MLPEPSAETFGVDPRVALCDVREDGGALSGTVAASLQAAVMAYTQERGLRLEVGFVSPVIKQVICGRTPLFKAPDIHSETVSEVGFGEAVNTYDAYEGFVRAAALRDAYLGWIPASALGTLPEPTHRFTALRGHVYAGPSVSAQRLLQLSYGAPIHVLGEADDWKSVALAGGTGYVPPRALTASSMPLEPSSDALTAFALRFLETPYLWGGVSAWGLDCSGLVQTVYRAFGTNLPRDSDQQAGCGTEVSATDVRAADLLFFPGHVAIALGSERFVHANARHMCVSVDSFEDEGYGRRLRKALTGVRRVLPQ